LVTVLSSPLPIRPHCPTPEEVADFLSRTIMFTFENHETMPVAAGKRLPLKDEMADASRNLAIKKEGKG
jgi:hypothetical protein